ncbi:MAG: enoyl-CoA hydratase/isomerase family protein, partial [Gammaproteobacteria bacterium]|nr:enoyl-CoA hydratase/isomerase family protein [Gammaproteobacteria bacterium]
MSYRLESEVAVLSIAHPPVNALSLPVRTALMEGLTRASADAAVAAIVLTGTGGTFSSGADIHEIGSGAALTSPTLRELQSEMEATPKPLVAAIDGIAFGGGLEIALTCHWRIGSRSARVGLPEVKLGLLPGAGGTQRFTRLAGPAAALEAITSGAALGAERALELGVLDAVADDALAAAIDFARQAARERLSLRVARGLDERLREGTPELFSEFRRRIAAKARGQLAPARIIDSIEAACTLPAEEAFRLERQYFLECRDSPQRRALTHVFFAEREARRIPGIPADTEPLPIRQAAVIGAGTMGGGIAMSFANAGIPVALLEVSPEALDRGLQVIRRNYAASVNRGSLDAARADA